MKILLLNGSPRKNGNTETALKLLAGELAKKGKESEIFDVCRHKIGGCIACEGCKKNGGTCVMPDETASSVEKFVKADFVVFASPVYWWGITAQLKAYVDKLYSKNGSFGKKRIGVIAVGGAETDDPEFRIIREQFENICAYLSWELVFDANYTAYETGDLAKDEDAARSLRALAEKI